MHKAKNPIAVSRLNACAITDLMFEYACAVSWISFTATEQSRLGSAGLKDSKDFLGAVCLCNRKFQKDFRILGIG